MLAKVATTLLAVTIYYTTDKFSLRVQNLLAKVAATLLAVNSTV